MASAILDMHGASKVDIASFLFDDPSITQALLHGLGSTPKMAVRVVVDRSAYKQQTCSNEQAQLTKLKRAKAMVYTAQGASGVPLFGPRAKPGKMHLKGMVIDNRICYIGSANFTKASRINHETMFRIVGPEVVDIYRKMLSVICDATAL